MKHATPNIERGASAPSSTAPARPAHPQRATADAARPRIAAPGNRLLKQNRRFLSKTVPDTVFFRFEGFVRIFQPERRFERVPECKKSRTRFSVPTRQHGRPSRDG